MATGAVASKDWRSVIYTAECPEGKPLHPEKQRRVLKWKDYFFINGFVFLTPHLKDIFTMAVITITDLINTDTKPKEERKTTMKKRSS